MKKYLLFGLTTLMVLTVLSQGWCAEPGKKGSQRLLLLISKGNKCGYIDTAGNVVIKPQFQDADRFSEGLARVKVYDEKTASFRYGFIDQTGKMVIPARYINAYFFGEGLASVQTEDKKWGFIDKKGCFVVEPIYDDCAIMFTDGYAYVKSKRTQEPSGKIIGGQYGLIDKTGKLVIPIVCDCINTIQIKQGLVSFAVGGEPYEDGFIYSKWGYADLNGKVVIKPVFSFVWDFEENGLAKVDIGSNFDAAGNLNEEKWGVINTKGEFILEPKFQDVLMVSNEIIAGCLDGKYGFFNRSGKVIIEPKYSNVMCLNEGLIGVQVGGVVKDGIIHDGKWGFINTKGDMVISPKYDDVGSFYDGIAPFNMNAKPNENGQMVRGKWGIIDSKGTVMIKPVYDGIHHSYSKSCIPVNVGGVERKFSGVIEVEGGKWGFINVKGDWLVKPVFDRVDYFEDGVDIARVYIGDKWGYISNTGKFIWEPSK